MVSYDEPKDVSGRQSHLEALQGGHTTVIILQALNTLDECQLRCSRWTTWQKLQAGLRLQHAFKNCHQTSVAPYKEALQQDAYRTQTKYERAFSRYAEQLTASGRVVDCMDPYASKCRANP